MPGVTEPVSSEITTLDATDRDATVPQNLHHLILRTAPDISEL
jgi:hypothetical protein